MGPVEQEESEEEEVLSFSFLLLWVFFPPSTTTTPFYSSEVLFVTSFFSGCSFSIRGLVFLLLLVSHSSSPHPAPLSSLIFSSPPFILLS